MLKFQVFFKETPARHQFYSEKFLLYSQGQEQHNDTGKKN